MDAHHTGRWRGGRAQEASSLTSHTPYVPPALHSAPNRNTFRILAEPLPVPRDTSPRAAAGVRLQYLRAVVDVFDELGRQLSGDVYLTLLRVCGAASGGAQVVSEMSAKRCVQQEAVRGERATFVLRQVQRLALNNDSAPLSIASIAHHQLCTTTHHPSSTLQHTGPTTQGPPRAPHRARPTTRGPSPSLSLSLSHRFSNRDAQAQLAEAMQLEGRLAAALDGAVTEDFGGGSSAGEGDDGQGGALPEAEDYEASLIEQ